MNYKMHYDRLIERARGRELDGYQERHHVIPRCLDGDDSAENIVLLTPEEHYVAHQLLVKMYPNEPKLVYAAMMMVATSKRQWRKNKLYGWLKRKYQKIAQQRTGTKNGSHGRPWYHNPLTLETGKFLPGTEPANWVRGRKPKPRCEECDKELKNMWSRLCKDHLHELRAMHGKRSGELYRNRSRSENYDRYTQAITTSKTWREAIERAGYKTDGHSRTILQEFARENNIGLLSE